MDYYEILGVPRNCDRDTLHGAFRQLSKKYHPDRFAEGSRIEAEKKYQTIVVAFNKLKNPAQRAQYDSTLSAPKVPLEDKDPTILAKKLFNTGQAKLERGDFEGALTAFKMAVHYREDPEYYYHKALAEKQLPKMQKEAIGSLQKAVARNPRNPKYYLQLAHFFTEFGLHVRARTVAEKAASLFPQNEEVQALAGELNPDKSKKGGLLGNLFGRKKGG